MDREDFLSTMGDILDSDTADVEPYMVAMDAAAAFGLRGDEAKAFIDKLRAEFEKDPEAMGQMQVRISNLDFHSDGVVNDNGGSDRESLESDLRTVQIEFARQFPDLAAQYGTDRTTVDDINVGYYAAA
jgi:hypothetical protein